MAKAMDKAVVSAQKKQKARKVSFPKAILQFGHWKYYICSNYENCSCVHFILIRLIQDKLPITD